MEFDHHNEGPTLKSMLTFILLFSLVIGCAVYNSPASDKHVEKVSKNAK